jgi:FlaA1/EpsC-like NDP-sugar epimerase
MNNAISNRTVLLTGGGGSIGSALAKTILELHPRFLILLDHSERNLHEIDYELNSIRGCASYTSILGDICDKALLFEILEYFHPEIVYHVAAFKHVPLMERNPVAAVRNNALGTNLLAKAVRAHGASKLIMISTDKAVNPRSVMGASKRVAELSLIRWKNSQTQMSALRLGNVLGSEGSVVPAFVRQISKGGPVTVTHPEVNRYFMTLEDAIELVVLMTSFDGDGGIFVPDLGEPLSILALAHQTIKESGLVPEQIQITFTGLRPGDKMSEELASGRESLETTRDARIFRTKSDEIVPDRFDADIKRLEESVEQRDLAATIDTICRIVPEYLPSASIHRLLERFSARIQ